MKYFIRCPLTGLQVILDLGRRPEARFLGQKGGEVLRNTEVCSSLIFTGLPMWLLTFPAGYDNFGISYTCACRKWEFGHCRSRGAILMQLSTRLGILGETTGRGFPAHCTASHAYEIVRVGFFSKERHVEMTSNVRLQLD